MKVRVLYASAFGNTTAEVVEVDDAEGEARIAAGQAEEIKAKPKAEPASKTKAKT